MLQEKACCSPVERKTRSSLPFQQSRKFKPDVSELSVCADELLLLFITKDDFRLQVILLCLGLVQLLGLFVVPQGILERQ